MAILKVARMGHPILRQKTTMLSEEEILAPETQKFVDDMVETMREYHGVGLAAPQVHSNKSLLVVELEGNPKDRNAPVIPLTIIFNVKIVEYSDSQDEDWEGCLSIPDLRGLVKRSTKIKIEALDRNAKPVSFKASGFFARVLQHEFDHLQGIMYPERMHDLSKFAFNEEFYRYGLDEE